MISAVSTEDGELILHRAGSVVTISGVEFDVHNNTQAILLFRSVKSAINVAAKDTQKLIIRDLFPDKADEIIENLERDWEALDGTE